METSEFDAIVVGSGISGGWAAKELTRIELDGNKIKLFAPFASPNFTLNVERAVKGNPVLVHKGETTKLARVDDTLKLDPNKWTKTGSNSLLCFDLPKGKSEIHL